MAKFQFPISVLIQKFKYFTQLLR